MALTTIIAKQQGTDGPEMVFLFCNTSMTPLECGGFDTIAEADAFAEWAARDDLGGDVRTSDPAWLRSARNEWLDSGRPGYDPGEDPDR